MDRIALEAEVVALDMWASVEATRLRAISAELRAGREVEAADVAEALDVLASGLMRTVHVARCAMLLGRMKAGNHEEGP